ncbi:MAG: hypothetical protein QOF21_963, partial [Actinomycetota bacterium]
MAASKWCPSCGAEYQPHVDECADCLVALTDKFPEPDDRRDTTRDHATVEFSVAAWPESRIRSLRRLLDGAGVAFLLHVDTGALEVNAADEATTEELLAIAGAADESEEIRSYGEAAAGEGTPDETVPAAGLGRRIVGRLVDGLVASLATAVLIGAFPFLVWPYDTTTMVVVIATVAAFEILCTARWGRTIGKFVVGTRVVDVHTDGIPSLSTATIRWALATLVSLV